MTDPIADALLRHYLTPPPAPAPPTPTWEPSRMARHMLSRWVSGSDDASESSFLRRLYAQLHRDRVAALVTVPGVEGTTLVQVSAEPVNAWLCRDDLLALADDGNGA